MKSKVNRVLSCLLTVLLLLTMLPVSALAEGDLKTELGITTEDVTVTDISEANNATLTNAALERYWGLYAANALDIFPGRIHSACHIASTADPKSPYVTLTMNVPEQKSEDEGGDEFPGATTGWAVLALVDGELVTYPTEKTDENKLKFTVRLGEAGTDLALASLTDASIPLYFATTGDWGTLTLQPGNVIKDDSLGWVRPYTLTLDISEGVKQRLQNEQFLYNFDLVFYLNSVGLKIDAESISFSENPLFQLDPEQTEKVSDGCYKFTASINIEAWKEGNFTNAVGVSYAAPNAESLLFEGELQVTLPPLNPWAGMIGCVPLAITVVNPPEDVNTYHKITVTQGKNGEISPRGVEGEVWVKDGDTPTFTITPDQGYHIADVIVDGESVGAVETYTFESVADDSHSITAVFEENPYVTITPANMTIYMGGDGGYEGVVGEDGNLVGEETSYNSLPEPLFKISAPSDVNPTELTFTNKTTWNSWQPVLAGTGSDGTAYYRLADQTDNTPIRVQFVDKDNNIHESDTFNPTDVGNLYVDYDINIFSGKQDVVTVTDTNNKEYNISRQSGTLTVRAVADSEPDDDPTVDVIDESRLPKVEAGKAVAVAPDNTTYTINDTGVPAVNVKPSLLFDSIIEDAADSTARTDALKARITSEYGADANVYEIKYLDLVDANNGNAWIKASKPVDIYWGYPATADQSTQFAVVHFKDLHRDGENSGYETSDIENCEVETIQAESTAQGIKFTVQPGQFSPFALVKAQVFTIEASAGENGSISPSGSVAVVKDTDQTFTITPNSGYHIADVKVDGVSVGAVDTYTFYDVAENHTISATFDRNSSGGGSGTRDDYTLHYVVNGGKHLSSETKSSPWTKPYEELPVPVRDGYTFEGWYTDLRLTQPVTGDVRVDSTTVDLYAKWSGGKDYGPDDTGVSKWLETDEHNAFLSGYPDCSFGPDKNMTRAEVAQMFYSLLLNKDVKITKSFSDVPADAWYAKAVNTLSSLGMLGGYPDGTFRPDAPITRAEFAAIALAFAYDPTNASCSYTDVSTVAWYYTYVAQATTYGWIGGYPDGSFRPNNSITRAEVAVIVNNMLGRSADERYIDRNSDELVDFVDLSSKHWAYYTIMEATNTHDYTSNSGGESWK